MSYNLFLDDIRDPIWVYHNPPFKEWIICRTYQEAVDLVNSKGYPDFISFDHDLSEPTTGYDFAKWLVDKDLNEHSMPDNFDYAIHSANPVGRSNIKGLLDAYIKYRSGTS